MVVGGGEGGRRGERFARQSRGWTGGGGRGREVLASSSSVQGKEGLGRWRGEEEGGPSQVPGLTRQLPHRHSLKLAIAPRHPPDHSITLASLSQVPPTPSIVLHLPLRLLEFDEVDVGDWLVRARWSEAGGVIVATAITGQRLVVVRSLDVRFCSSPPRTRSSFPSSSHLQALGHLPTNDTDSRYTCCGRERSSSAHSFPSSLSASLYSFSPSLVAFPRYLLHRRPQRSPVLPLHPASSLERGLLVPRRNRTSFVR